MTGQNGRGEGERAEAAALAPTFLFPIPPISPLSAFFLTLSPAVLLFSALSLPGRQKAQQRSGGREGEAGRVGNGELLHFPCKISEYSSWHQAIQSGYVLLDQKKETHKLLQAKKGYLFFLILIWLWLPTFRSLSLSGLVFMSLICIFPWSDWRGWKLFFFLWCCVVIWLGLVRLLQD